MVLGRCWSLESRKLLEIFKGSWPSRFFNDNVAFVDKFCWIFGFKKELQFPPWKCRLPDRYSSRHSCGFVLFCFFSPWRTRVAPHCRLTKGYFFYDFQFILVLDANQTSNRINGYFQRNFKMSQTLIDYWLLPILQTGLVFIHYYFEQNVSQP